MYNILNPYKIEINTCFNFCSFAEWDNLGKRHYLQNEAPTSKYLNTNHEKKMAEERIYAQVERVNKSGDNYSLSADFLANSSHIMAVVSTVWL